MVIAEAGRTRREAVRVVVLATAVVVAATAVVVVVTLIVDRAATDRVEILAAGHLPRGAPPITSLRVKVTSCRQRKARVALLQRMP